MIIPVKCFTCGKVLADKYMFYTREVRKMKLDKEQDPDKVVYLPFDQKKETLFYAGSDIFLLPSNHEPCGINQLIAMRYGCVPVVREVGGLYDTVDNYSSITKKGTGFTFEENDSFMFFRAIVRALEVEKNKKDWDKLISRIMRRSNSWEIPAKKYVELYNKVLKN
jgi:starch synthase